MNTTATVTGYEVVREQGLDGIRDDLVAVMNATRRRAVNGDRFDWLYNANPDGPAVIWSLRKCGTGEMVGFTSCLPRRMLVNGEMRRAWIGSDFSVLPRYRTLGLAVKLRRAAKDAIDAGEADFLYAHPNDRMAVIHQRAGHSFVGLMQRYARVLRTGPLLEERVKLRMFGKLGGAVLDPFLRIADPERRFRRRYRIERTDKAAFDARFDRLFDVATPRRAIIGVRDALYLNWRYGRNPLTESRLVTALDGDRLAGYLVFNLEDDTLVIKDVFPATDAVLVRDLLAEVTRWGRELRVRSASFTVFQPHPILPTLRQLGYRPRPEQSQMFAYASPEAADRQGFDQAEHWQITVGDRDV